LTKLDEQHVSLLAQQAAIGEVVRHTRNRDRASYISYIEQLDAQKALLNVELALVQLRADRLNMPIGLYQAVGGSPAVIAERQSKSVHIKVDCQ
jgi:outer membrane protein, multidrug efflux system